MGKGGQPLGHLHFNTLSYMVWMDKLCSHGCSSLFSTLSSCSHAVVALLYPFSWQHTFIPVLPSSMIDIVCCPTPFLVGLLSSSLPKLKELPVEEVGAGTKIICLD